MRLTVCPAFDGVERAEDQMARFGRRKPDFHGFPVAHFAHQDDLGGSAQRSAQSGGEIGEIASHFPLVERRFLVGMDELYRVFQRDDAPHEIQRRLGSARITSRVG